MKRLYEQIEAAKTRLSKRANKLGYIPEHFGQADARKLTDDYLHSDDIFKVMQAVGDFELWLMDYKVQS